MGNGLALFGPVGQCASTHSFHALERPREVLGFTASFFFFLINKEQLVASNEVLPNPCVSTETLKAFALIGVHLLAADCEVGSSGGQSLDLGDTWRYGYPKSLDWNGNVESWTECEGTSSSEQCEHHVESLALNVMAQVQSGEKISLFLGRLGICEGGFELPHRPGHVVPGNA